MQQKVETLTYLGHAFVKEFLAVGHNVLLVDSIELLLHLLKLAEHFTLGGERLAVWVVLS